METEKQKYNWKLRIGLSAFVLFTVYAINFILNPYASMWKELLSWSKFELAFVGVDQIEHHPVCRNERPRRYLLQDILVGIVVVIVMVSSDVEETISLQPVRLMYLKIKANCFHIFIVL